MGGPALPSLSPRETLRNEDGSETGTQQRAELLRLQLCKGQTVRLVPVGRGWTGGLNTPWLLTIKPLCAQLLVCYTMDHFLFVFQKGLRRLMNKYRIKTVAESKSRTN